jgi:hypothetical protein
LRSCQSVNQIDTDQHLFTKIHFNEIRQIGKGQSKSNFCSAQFPNSLSQPDQPQRTLSTNSLYKFFLPTLSASLRLCVLNFQIPHRKLPIRQQSLHPYHFSKRAESCEPIALSEAHYNVFSLERVYPWHGFVEQTAMIF